MAKRIVAPGDTFGRFTVESFGPRGRYRTWWCRCVCGTLKLITEGNMKSTVSCGCWRRERIGNARRTHGRTKTTEHKIWSGMLYRCLNKDARQYPDYGGRGISVIARWSRFENFLADMGPRPSTLHTLERTDNGAGYSPSNCIWALPEQQQNNRRVSAYITVHGERLTLAQAGQRYSVNPNTIADRIRRIGLTPEEAVRTPSKRRG